MLSVIVDGLWREGDKSLAVRLVAENGAALPAWQPGAHIDVHLPCGLVRQYSLTGACEDEGYLICVGRETPRAAGRATFTRRCGLDRNSRSPPHAICSRSFRQSGFYSWLRALALRRCLRWPCS